MQIDDIIAMVDRRKDALSVVYQKDAGYPYLKQFVSDNKVQNLRDFLEADIWEYIKCLYYVRSSKKHSIEEYQKKFDSFYDMIGNLSSKAIEALIEICDDFADDSSINQILAYLNSKIPLGKSSLRKINSKSPYIAELVVRFKQLQNDGISISTFLELLKEDSDTLLDVLDLYRVHVKIAEVMAEEREKIEQTADEMKVSVRNRDIDRYLDSLIRDNYYVDKMIAELNEIRAFVLNEERTERRVSQDNKKEIRDLNMAIVKLKRAIEKEEITNAREISTLIRDLSIRRCVLQFIYDHNSAYYEKLEEEHASISNNSKIQFQVLLKEYGIVLYDVETIMHHDIEELKVILKTLQKLGFDFQKIIPVLQLSDLSSVMSISNYISMGYIPVTYLNTHIDLLYTDSKARNTFEKNLEVLKEYGINPLQFYNSVAVLFIDSSILSKNLEYCLNYGLLSSFKTTQDYHFLENNQLEKLIDTYLELGYEKLLESDLGLLNTENIKRLEVLKALNMPVDSLEELHSILEEKQFFIPDGNLDDYIFDIVPYMEEKDISHSLDDLRTFLITPNVYSFNGVCVSSKKVKRILEEGKSLYQAIFTGLKLSKDEYQSIISILCEKDNTDKKTL